MISNILPNHRHHIHSFLDACELLTSKGLHVNYDLSWESEIYCYVCSVELTGISHDMTLKLNKQTGTLVVNSKEWIVS